MNKEKFMLTEKKYLVDNMNYLKKLVEIDMHQISNYDFKKIKTLKLIQRLFSQEIDYLCEDPLNYRELYNDEHLNN